MMMLKFVSSFIKNGSEYDLDLMKVRLRTSPFSSLTLQFISPHTLSFNLTPTSPLHIHTATHTFIFTSSNTHQF